MGSRGLLSRLAGKGGSSRGDDDLTSITEHLRVLLNTRQGESATVPQFGIPDFSDVVHNFPGAIQVLQRAIRQTILDFEPRLKNVAVRHTPDEDPLIVRFEITAQLTGGRGRGLLKFQTAIKPGGKFDVNS